MGLPEPATFEGEAESGCFRGFEVFAGSSNETVGISLNHL